MVARAKSCMSAPAKSSFLNCKQNPKISALTITREQAALEAAILKLEAELQPRAKNNERKSSLPDRSDLTEADHLGEMPKALAAMLFGIAYLAAIVAFSGVVYLRGLALVYADIIQYPILLGAMVGLGCLFVPLSRAVFRRLRVYSRSPIQWSGARRSNAVRALSVFGCIRHLTE